MGETYRHTDGRTDRHVPFTSRRNTRSKLLDLIRNIVGGGGGEGVQSTRYLAVRDGEVAGPGPGICVGSPPLGGNLMILWGEEEVRAPVVLHKILAVGNGLYLIKYR